MGNEASLEGGDGGLSGLPEGLAPDGKGGFVRIPGGEEADLGRLSEAERRQLAAAMSRAHGGRAGEARDAASHRQDITAPVRKTGASEGATRGPSGLSKSRTVDAFGEGPPPKPKPGRSPSSLSLFESRFRQEPKDPSEQRSGMFSSGFLSGANPLSAVSSAVSSASISKFSLFGDEEEEASKQGGKPPGAPVGPGKGPQPQGPPKGQGPPHQKGGPPPQGPGKPGGPGPQQQGPPKAGGPQQGPTKGGPPPGGPAPPGSQQKGPSGPGAPPPGPAKAGALCPLCKATELNTQAKDQAPNYSTCTQCKQQVCSLCGFSPPDSAGKEWLCLNCQMQRAMAGAELPGPPAMKPQASKTGSAPPSPQRKEPPTSGPPHKSESRKPPMLTKQSSIVDSGKAGTPPVTPKLKSPGPLSPGPPQSLPGSQPGSQPSSPGPKTGPGGSPKVDPKTGRPIQQGPTGSPGASPAKAAPPPKQDTGFFGSFGLGGLTDAAKPAAPSQAAESVTGKLFGGFGSSKPQPSESVTGKLFSGFGGLSESAKPPATASQAAEAVSGKMFGFGSSILSSATSLISSNADEEEKGDSPPGSPPDSPIEADSAPGSPPDSDSAPDTPPATSKEPPTPKVPPVEPEKAGEPLKPAPGPEVPSSCPLCKTPLNATSGEPPNYSTCTECKKTVCNLCGFNPTPHLGEIEWLCLNCQTQRALSGQLGDMPPSPMPSPAKHQAKPASAASTPPASPAPVPASPAPDTQQSPAVTAPVAPAKELKRTPSIAQVQTEKPDPEPAEASERVADTAAAAVATAEREGGIALQESTEKVSEEGQAQTPALESAKAESLPAQAEQPLPPPSNICREAKDMDEGSVQAPEVLNTQSELEPEIAESSALSPAEQKPDAEETVIEQLEMINNCTSACAEATTTEAEPEEVKQDPPFKAEDDNNTQERSITTIAALKPAELPLADKQEEISPGKTLQGQSEPQSSDPDPATQSVTAEDGSPSSPGDSKNQTQFTDSVSESAKPRPGDQQLTQDSEPQVLSSSHEPEQTSPLGNSVSPDTIADVKSQDILSHVKRGEQTEANIRTDAQPPPVASDTSEMEAFSRVTESEARLGKDTQELQGGAGEPSSSEASEKQEPKVENDLQAKEAEASEKAKAIVDQSSSNKEQSVSKENDKVKSQHETTAKYSHPECTSGHEQTNEIAPETFSDSKQESTLSCETQSSGEVQTDKSLEESTPSIQHEPSSPSHVGQNTALLEQNRVSKDGAGTSECGITQADSAVSDQTDHTTHIQPLPRTLQTEQTSATDHDSDKKSVPQDQISKKFLKDTDSCVKVTESTPADPGSEDVSNTKDPVAVPESPPSVVSKQVKGKCSEEESLQRTDGETPPVSVDDLGEQRAEAVYELKEMEQLKAAVNKDASGQEGSPTSPSDLAKLESTVLPILEAQSTTRTKEDSQKPSDPVKGRRRLEVLPMSPEQSPDDEGAVQAKKDESGDASGPKKERKKLMVPAELCKDSLEDSSESEPSPSLQKTEKLCTKLDYEGDSPASTEEEDSIRKQIMEMSADEDTLPSDDEKMKRQKIREDENKILEKDEKEKSDAGKVRRLLKKSSISPEQDDGLKNLTSLAQTVEAPKEEPEKGDRPLIENAAGIRHFKTIELNTAATVRQTSDDGEPESLTDSPDDRSRGEGSSSLHASSFTPGTSPTSMSSLDEDSDSSSPSHIRSSGEGKQHRKAKHRQPGQVLPTIEDSSEEEELREEEELLREQEKHKGSGKKSKKDKEEIRAQRRREHPKTPPSNLSPIEDASPTEELRQEAEMEEFRRSSCSDFSPSMESDPEGLEIHPEKIAAVQKVYQLPTSVSLYSPTDEEHSDKLSNETRPLKTADEAYDEIMLRAKSPNFENELPLGKESLYGGMLIEDYVYESLVEDTTEERQTEKITVTEKPKILRSPDEVYKDMMKKKEIMLKEHELKQPQPLKKLPQPEIILSDTISSSVTITTSSEVTLGKDGKPLLDAEAAYEELMKRQKSVLTPGTSPTLPGPDIKDVGFEGEAAPESAEIVSGVSQKRALYPIPDLRVIQCSSGEEELDDDSITEEKPENMPSSSPEPTEPVLQSTTSPSPTTEPVSNLDHVLAQSEVQSCQPSPDVQQTHPETSVTDPLVVAPHPDLNTDVVDLSKTSVSSQEDLASAPAPVVVTRPSAPLAASVSPLPTVPQYVPATPSIVSTAPPIPPKPAVLRRGVSQEKTDIPVPPPLPPPTLPKPTLYSKKISPQVPPKTAGMNATGPTVSVRQPMAPTYKPHVPPPVPPKPTSIPAGLTFSHRPCDKPPVAPKPMSSVQPPSPAHVPVRPSVLTTGTTEIALNLSPSADSKPGATSPKCGSTPSSPRHTKSLHDTYVVITLPSQPNSPVDGGITTQAPTSPGSTSQCHRITQPEPPPQTTRVPLAFTRITESIESQEICGPERVVSSRSHVYEAISSTQAPATLPNAVAQVVTTEMQRTTVSVVHERVPPPLTTPGANGLSSTPVNLKAPSQPSQSYCAGEVVDLRTPKIDADTIRKGVDLSSSESRRQSLATEALPKQTSAVQSSVVNLSIEPASSVSVVTDSITILTCTATISYGSDTSQATSMPLQLTTVKSFEPVSQIVYRPVDAQPEKPINLSIGVSKNLTPPVTLAPTSVTNGIGASIPPRMDTGVSGAMDLTTTKPFQSVVSVDGSSSEVVTAVVTEEDGKPVDLTAGRRAVCCDVVYKLPFAGSCATQQTPAPLPEDRFGYRDDHYQYDRSPYGMRGFGGIKPSMSDTNLAEAGLFLYKSKNSYDYNVTESAVDLTSGKMSEAGLAVDYSCRTTVAYSGMTIPQYSQARITSAVGTHFGATSVLRSSNGVMYSSVAAPVPSTYAITTQPGSIFSTTYNTLSGMHTSDTMPSLSSLQSHPLTRSHSFLSTIITTTAAEQEQEQPLNLETGFSKDTVSAALSEPAPIVTTISALDSYTDASLEAIAASLEALSSPMMAGDGQYQMERELLELEKIKQQRLAEELEWERQEIHRFREQEQMIVQKELEELQVMKQQILCQQEEERQAHLMMQKETYAQQQQQLEQIQRLQEQLRQQLEEQKFRQMYPGELKDATQQEALLGLAESKKIMDSGVQTDEEDNAADQAYSGGRKKRIAKKSVDSCVQTDDEDQDEWEVPARGRRSKPRGEKFSTGERSGQMSVQALTEISVQTDSSGGLRGHSLQVDTRVEYPDSGRTSSPQRDKRRAIPLEIDQSPHLKADSSSLQVSPAPPKSPKVLYSPISPCVSPSKSLEFLSYEKSLGDTSPQRARAAADPSKALPGSSRPAKVMQRSMSDPKPVSPTAEERAAANVQFSDGYSAKASPGGTPTGTQKKVKRTLPNPPSEEEAATAGQTAYSTGSARRRLCRSSNMARAKILQDIDRELDLVERESSKLRKKQAELDEEEKEIDAKLRYLEMGINRRKDVLLKEREKRERAYLQSVAEDRDYMSDSEVSNIRETRRGGGGEEVGSHGLERPRTAPQSELEQFVPPQTTHDAQYGKYSQYQYPQQTLYQQSLYQSQPYQSQSIYSSVPSLSASQQQNYHQMLLLQQKARQQAALLSELDATKMTTSYDVIRSQSDASSYLSGKYGNHLDLRVLEDRGGSIAGSPMSNVSADSFYADVDPQTPRSYLLLEDAADLTKGTSGLSGSTYGMAEKELAKAERLLRRTAADVGTDYLGSSTRLHTYGKAQEDEDSMEEPYELKLLKQQLKQEFRRSATGTESLEQLAGLPHHYYTPSSGVSSSAYRPFPKTEKYSMSRLTLEKQAAKQLPTSMLYQKHKTPLTDPKLGKYSSGQDTRSLEVDYNSYLGSTGSSPRSSRLLQDEITFGLRKNIAEQQKYLGSNLGANLAGSLNLGQSLNLSPGMRTSLGEDSSYPSGSRSRPSSRPSSMYGLDLSLKRDLSSSSLRLKAESEGSTETSAYQTPSGRTKPTSLPIGPGGRGRIPIVAQNSEEESPLSPVGQPMGMARASAGPLPPISADSRDQFGSCLSLQDSQQQHLRDDPTRGRGYVLMDDLQGTMSDSEALSDSLVVLNRDDPGNSHENVNAYHLRREETDWFDKPRDGRPETDQATGRRQMKSIHYPFPHTRVRIQRDPKDRSVSGNGLGIRVVGGKEVPGGNGEIGAYVAKVLPGGAAEQTGKLVEGMQVLEWNSVLLTGKTYEEVQGLVGQQCEEAELCIRLDLNMLSDSEISQHLDIQDSGRAGDRQKSPGVDPKQLAAELQKVSQQQAPASLSAGDKGPHAASGTASAASSTIPSPGQPSSPSISKKRHSKSSDAAKTQSHPVTGDIQLQINYDKQLGNLIVHVLQARNLAPRDNNGYSDPFVKVYLLPGRGAENKRRSKHAQKTLNPEWNQTVIYKNIHLEQLRKKTLEVSVWDYDKSSSNDFLGEVLIDLSNTAQLDNVPRWLPLREQSEGEHHRRSHSGQSRQHSPKPPVHGSPKTSGHGSHDSPKSSVIKSRSHGIFPDPAKDTQVPTIEKSHSSPGTSKPSPSEGQARSHGPSRTSSKSGAARTHHKDATSEAANQQQQQQQQQQQHHFQPTQNGRLSLRHHRHSVEGVLTIQRPPSDSPANESWDGRHLILRKALSEERPQTDGASRSHRSGDAPLTAASLDSGLSGSAYSLLEEDEDGTNAVDSAIFHVPRFGKIPNGTDVVKSSDGDSEAKTQVMGEIKIALKKEMKTEGEQLVLEILQCRNITYKFKSPDHLPDLYVKLYVVNVATQKRIIKKKTRVCRHDREPSFNETFRFFMNPAGHSLQLFLVSNGGKFVKKTLIGEAYVWLDKVDLRKRVVSWHKLLASSAQIHS
ncbi:protein piccolo isoform X4 [Denticeps clupeoides]|uniref:protein piccolo isoform X4 n=1 Tax=Denticeps clupeoides TaxID=299321 RepID=UPI0010A4DC90|nr:protein piccolo-like isoform X4 [Denticeps clupeoides]